MQAFLRDLTRLAVVTAAGGFALVRAVAPSGPRAADSWMPVVDRPMGFELATEDCARRAALLPSMAPARFEFQVDHPARFLGARGRPRLTASDAPAQRALVHFVVDTAGAVVQSSIRLLHVTGDSTVAAAAIRTAARRWRYSPAVAEGCPTPQIVQTIVEL